MTKTLEQAVEKVKKLSRERQEYAAEVLELIAEAGDEVTILTDEERRLVREGLDELARGEIASDAEVRAVFDKYRVGNRIRAVHLHSGDDANPEGIAKALSKGREPQIT
jgi:hypothetical protein